MVLKFNVVVSKVLKDKVTFRDKESGKQTERETFGVLGITDEGDFVQVKYYEKPPFFDILKKGDTLKVAVSSFDGGRNSQHMAECIGAF